MRAVRLLLIGVVPAAAFLAGCGGAARSAPSRPAGTLVIVHRDEEHLTLVNARTGRSRTVRTPWLGKCTRPPFFTGGRLILPGVEGNRAVALAFGPDLRGRRRLGYSWDLVRSAEEGRLWLTGMSRRTTGRVGRVREVTVDGRVTMHARRRPPGGYLAGAVSAGLLFQSRATLLVWSPATGRVIRRLPGPFLVGTQGNRVASCDEGECRRGVWISNAASGTRTLVSPPAGSSRFEPQGAFAPRGSGLAIVATTPGGRRVALIDAATGQARLVRARVAPDYPSLAWSSSGDWLFFNAGRGIFKDRSARIMAARLGSSKAIRIPLRAPPVFSMGAG